MQGIEKQFKFRNVRLPIVVNRELEILDLRLMQICIDFFEG